jgi:hypothetical protein
LDPKISSAPSLTRGAQSSALRRAIGPVALCALVALAQSVAAADQSHAAGAASHVRLLAAAPPAATATAAATAAAAAPAASGGSFHDRAGGKPVAIIFDSSSWTGPFATIGQGVAESAQDFATKFGHRFNVETTVVDTPIKSAKDVDDAVKASGALLGTAYLATVHGQPHSKTTEWTFALRTKFRDAAGTPWLDLKKEVDVQYPGLSNYHEITVNNLSPLNDQVIDALAKESAK